MTPDEPPHPLGGLPAGKNPPDSGEPSSRTVAIRAVLGFLTYVLVGWFSLAIYRGSGVPLAALVIIATAMAIARAWRGFPLGVFIGVGLTLLAIGACFLALAK